MQDELHARIQSVEGDLEQARRELHRREAPLRAVLVEEEQAVAALRAQASELRSRIEGYQAEVAQLDGSRSPFVPHAGRLLRMFPLLPVFLAGSMSLDPHTPQAIAGGLAAFAVAGLWRVRRG